MKEFLGTNLDNKKSGELEQAAKTFFEYLRVEDKPEKVDAIFVLGGSTTTPAERAAELYKQGYAKYVVAIAMRGTFSNKDWDMDENEKYREVLEELGIPGDAILTSSVSTNTLEEAQAAIPFLKGRGVDPQKIILVSRPIHQRRAWATFQKQHSDIRYINCPSNEPLDINDLGTRKRLVAEAERLLRYSKKGDLEKQEIPYATLRAAARIRMYLKATGEYKK